MEQLRKTAANLLKVKSLVTLPLTVVFCILALGGEIPSEYLAVYTTVIGFYFGTQHERKEVEANG